MVTSTSSIKMLVFLYTLLFTKHYTREKSRFVIPPRRGFNPPQRGDEEAYGLGLPEGLWGRVQKFMLLIRLNVKIRLYEGPCAKAHYERDLT
jgi:hypothetical protein